MHRDHLQRRGRGAARQPVDTLGVGEHEHGAPHSAGPYASSSLCHIALIAIAIAPIDVIAPFIVP